MNRQEAIDAMGAWLTSDDMAPLVEIGPSGIIFPDPYNEIVSVTMVGLYSMVIRRQFDGLLIRLDDTVPTEEFLEWMEIINT